jgi:hypothetical protein
MGNCSTCGCNDLGEVKTNEVMVEDKHQRNSTKAYQNPQSNNQQYNQQTSTVSKYITLTSGRREEKKTWLSSASTSS